MTNSNRVKYPRTLHMPFSRGVTSDDKMLSYDKLYELYSGKQVLITEKLDGECTTLYKDYSHARSLDSNHHPSRDWVKRFHSEIAHNIPEGWRVCGENVFAKHSISYDNLDSYFYGFSIWDENNNCLSTDETEEWFQLLGIVHAPILSYCILYGNWVDGIQDLAEVVVENGKEGIVMRNRESFHYNDFKHNVVKYVRENHVQTSDHWAHQTVIPNKLKDK